MSAPKLDVPSHLGPYDDTPPPWSPVAGGGGNGNAEQRPWQEGPRRRLVSVHLKIQPEARGTGCSD